MYDLVWKKVISIINYYGIKFVDHFIFYGGKLFGRIIFPILLLFNLKKYVNQQSYFPEYKLKGNLRIFFEQLIYIFRHGEMNGLYFLFGFDRISKNDFKKYVPLLTFTHSRNVKNQLPAKPEYYFHNYLCLLRDKFLFGAFCKGTGINTPTNLAMINYGKIFLIKENTCIPLNEITNYEMNAFGKREVSYGGGLSCNTILLKINGGKIYLNGEESDLVKLKQIIGEDRWIIQERIINQNPEFARFHPDSINTLRIVTVKDRSDIKIFYAMFRMGVNGSHADNWSSGGIITGVNIEDGVLEKWGFFKVGYGTKSDRHPNTQILFDGYKLPYWEQITQFVKQAHFLFYGFHSIGWDVAVTTEGVMLIEGNDNWNPDAAQLYKGSKMTFKQYFK